MLENGAYFTTIVLRHSPLRRGVSGLLKEDNPLHGVRVIAGLRQSSTSHFAIREYQ